MDSKQVKGELLAALTTPIWPLPKSAARSLHPLLRSTPDKVQIHSPEANSPLCETSSISRYPGWSSSFHLPTMAGI